MTDAHAVIIPSAVASGYRNSVKDHEYLAVVGRHDCRAGRSNGRGQTIDAIEQDVAQLKSNPVGPRGESFTQAVRRRSEVDLCPQTDE